MLARNLLLLALIGAVLQGCGDKAITAVPGSTATVGGTSHAVRVPAEISWKRGSVEEVAAPPSFANRFSTVTWTRRDGSTRGTCIVGADSAGEPIGTNCYDARTIKSGRAIQGQPSRSGLETVGLLGSGWRKVTVVVGEKRINALVRGRAWSASATAPATELVVEGSGGKRRIKLD